MNNFSVSYARFNDCELSESDTARRGMLDSGVSLDDAIRTVRNETVAASESHGVSASNSDATRAQWVTLRSEEWETGDNLELSIHFPDNATPATRARLVRLLTKEL